MNPKLKALVDGLAEDFKFTVAKIEGGIKTTKDNYGSYMNLISTLSKGDSNVAHVISLALIKAGANANGVGSAMRILHP